MFDWIGAMFYWIGVIAIVMASLVFIRLVWRRLNGQLTAAWIALGVKENPFTSTHPPMGWKEVPAMWCDWCHGQFESLHRWRDKEACEACYIKILEALREEKEQCSIGSE